MLRIRQHTIGNYTGTLEKFKLVISGLPFRATEFVIDGKVHAVGARNEAVGKYKITVDHHFHEFIIR
jgi:alpha-glucosidase